MIKYATPETEPDDYGDGTMGGGAHATCKWCQTDLVYLRPGDWWHSIPGLGLYARCGYPDDDKPDMPEVEGEPEPYPTQNALSLGRGQLAWSSGQTLDTDSVGDAWFAYGWTYSALLDLAAAIKYQASPEQMQYLLKRLEGVVPL